MTPLVDNLPDFPDFAPGEVWLAGAGPGDPGLLTLYALHALRVADDIVHDALVDPRILKLAGHQAKLIFAGKRGGKPSAQQADINDILIERARRLRFRIIRGITSGLAAAALAGIPATMQGVSAPAIVIVGAVAAIRQQLVSNMAGWR